MQKLERGLEQYRRDYTAYYEACKHPDSPAIHDPNPSEYIALPRQEAFNIEYWLLEETKLQHHRLYCRREMGPDLYHRRYRRLSNSRRGAQALAGARAPRDSRADHQRQRRRCQEGILGVRYRQAAAKHPVRELAIELAPATVLEGSSMFPGDCVISSLTKYNIPFDEVDDTDRLRQRLANFSAQRTLPKTPVLPAD